MDLSSTKHSPSIFSLDVAICPKEKREKGWKHVKMRKKNDDAKDVPIGTLFQFCLVLQFWLYFAQILLHIRSLFNKIFQN